VKENYYLLKEKLISYWEKLIWKDLHWSQQKCILKKEKLKLKLLLLKEKGSMTKGKLKRKEIGIEKRLDCLEKQANLK